MVHLLNSNLPCQQICPKHTASENNSRSSYSGQLTKGRVVAASGDDGCASGW